MLLPALSNPAPKAQKPSARVCYPAAGRSAAQFARWHKPIPLWIAAILLVLLSLAGFQAEESGPPEDCAFKARIDGSIERYVKLLPARFDPLKQHLLLIVLHGHGSDRWQYVREPRGECRAARDVAARFSLIFISPDYRAATSWMGPRAEADLVQIIQELRAQYRVSKIIVSGASMGGAGALSFAALHPELVDGVVSLNGTANLLEYENFQPAIQASFGGTKLQIPEEYKKRSAEYWPERLTMPIALSAGGQDTAVPPQSVVRLAKVLKTLQRPVLLLMQDNGGHSTSYEESIAAYEFTIYEILKHP